MTTLQRLRQSKDKTVMELAKATDLRPSALSDLEHGRRAPTESEAWRLAEALGVTPTDIREAVKDSKEETAKVVAVLEAIASGGPMPEGVEVIISCSRGRGCQVHRRKK